MGYWTNSTYIRAGDTDTVIGALVELLESEGMRLVPRPAERVRFRYEPMQYLEGSRNNLWALAVFPGAPGWTVIKTAPLSLLAERGPGAMQMRLVELCRHLRAPGFHLTVYDSCAGVLAETDGQGTLRLSGHTLDQAEPMRFYGQIIDEDRLSPRFDILPLQDVADAHTSAHGSYRVIDWQGVAETLEALLGGENTRFCDNLTCVDTLICHRPLLSAGGRDLYFEWPPGDRRDREVGGDGEEPSAPDDQDPGSRLRTPDRST